jgi:hypothetical protein
MFGYLMLLLAGLGAFAFAVLFGPGLMRLAGGNKRHRRR